METKMGRSFWSQRHTISVVHVVTFAFCPHSGLLEPLIFFIIMHILVDT